MVPDKDYSNFYGTSAGVIPVLVLIYVIEARGFGRRISRSHRIMAVIFLVLAVAGEITALLTLAAGSPADNGTVPFVVVGLSGGLILASMGVREIIRSDQKPGERETPP